MGQSTDAILFYGYVWSDEGHQLWDRSDYDDWYEALAKRRGHASPWDLYKSSGAEAAHSNLPYKDQSAAYRAWKDEVGFDAMVKEWDAIKDAIEAEHPDISVGTHCSGECPMPYICIADTEQTARRGYPEAVNVAKVSETNKAWWNAALSDFIETMEIDLSAPEYGEAPQGPGWFLVSDWN